MLIDCCEAKLACNPHIDSERAKTLWLEQEAKIDLINHLLGIE
jgi:hypothetical protein